MVHYSELDSDNIVTQIVVISDADENGTEANGIAFCQSLFGDDTVWKKTSYNTHAGVHKTGGTPFRMNYAQIGDTYNSEHDGFFKTSEPQPFDSWTMSTTTGIWTAPTPMPTDDPQDGYVWGWDETTLSWVEVEEPEFEEPESE